MSQSLTAMYGMDEPTRDEVTTLVEEHTDDYNASALNGSVNIQLHSAEHLPAITAQLSDNGFGFDVSQVFETPPKITVRSKITIPDN